MLYKHALKIVERGLLRRTTTLVQHRPSFSLVTEHCIFGGPDAKQSVEISAELYASTLRASTRTRLDAFPSIHLVLEFSLSTAFSLSPGQHTLLTLSSYGRRISVHAQCTPGTNRVTR